MCPTVNLVASGYSSQSSVVTRLNEAVEHVKMRASIQPAPPEAFPPVSRLHEVMCVAVLVTMTTMALCEVHGPRCLPRELRTSPVAAKGLLVL